MNSDKHKKDPTREWLAGEETPVPAHSRSSRVLASFVKIRKQPAQKARRVLPQESPIQPDNLWMREPGGAVVEESKRPQLASWDHLTRMQRLGRMRASFEFLPPRQRAPGIGTPQTRIQPRPVRGVNKPGRKTRSG
jgi:hypothetical protein